MVRLSPKIGIAKAAVQIGIVFRNKFASVAEISFKTLNHKKNAIDVFTIEIVKSKIHEKKDIWKIFSKLSKKRAEKSIIGTPIAMEL